ncbi:MAG: adaptor protein MecA [Clostridia bacterium]|nr:adaptor protein MecA [Clostridia bacterium]
MELLQINKNKLKITLSVRDLEEFDLTVSTLDYNTTKTRKAIWEIFDRAKRQVGFDAAKSKLKIKVYPLSDGGCDMYVSKLSQGYSELHAVRSTFRSSVKKCAYIFNSFSEVYALCTLMPVTTHSSLYSDMLGRYILLIDQGFDLRGRKKLLSEFGSLLNISYIESYLNERCTLICKENAVLKITAR